MAGKLTISTLNDSSGVLATQNGMTGICKCWIVFNMSTSVIAGSFNVASITKNGTGDFTITFSTAMPNANYATIGSALKNNADYDGKFTQYSTTAATTGSIRVAADNASTGGIDYTDALVVSVAVFSS